MLRPKMLPAILVAVSAVTVLTARASFSEPQAQECKAAPGPSTPHGGHWRYRINHTDKQRCWYLSPEDARTVVHVTASFPSTSVPARLKKSAGRALPSEPPPAAAVESSATDAAASAPAAPAEVALQRPSSEAGEGGAGFGARWPENLADAQDMSAKDTEQTAPPPPSNSYAENQADSDAAQMPSRWPGIETSRAGLSFDVDSLLRSFSVTGALLMVALLLAGWAARFVRGPAGWRFAHRGRAIATPTGVPSRPVDAAEIAEGAHEQADDAGTPTDPAHDLKTSLAELMRDLHRAEAASGSVRLPRRRGHQLRDDVQHQTLLAAE